jgi:hypothetical protein
VTYTTKDLTPATWADFERLFAPGRGWSFCACMLYQRGCHLDAKRFPDRASSRAQNQAEKRALVDAGRAHGILVYDDREPMRPKKTWGDLRQTNRLVKVCDRGAT